MQHSLTQADRKLIGFSGALFAVLIAATVLMTPVTESGFSPVPSSYLSTPGGARAAFLLLRRLGIDVQRWQEPPFRLAGLASGATLVIAEPIQKPSHAERAVLRRFVERGGRILFCGAQLPEFFPGVELRDLSGNAQSALPLESASSPSIEYAPTVSGSSSQRIQMQPEAEWTKIQPHQAAVYGDAHAAVVTVWSIGAGELIWWAAATPLTNIGLQQAGNLPLFLNSIGVGARTRVYWDEYFHGETGSLWDYIGRVPALRWAALQFALLAAACLLTFSRRSGPIVAPVRVSRLSPLEFVDTLGALYRKAKAAPLAVDVAARHLRLQLTRKLVLPAGIADTDLAQAATERLGWNRAELQAVLDAARLASSAKSFSSSRALQLVQQLQRWSARLAGPRTPQIQSLTRNGPPPEN